MICLISLLTYGFISCVSSPEGSASVSNASLLEGDCLIQSLGLAGVRIQTVDQVIYVDAFAKGITVSNCEDASIILITHGDGDHFDVGKVENALENSQAVVVAPKGVIESIDSQYSQRLITLEPDADLQREEVGLVVITAFRTDHFNDHPELNNSYLVEINEKRIFISGDSLDYGGIEDIIGGSDLFIVNYLDWNLDSALAPLIEGYGETTLFLSHLINCSWSLQPSSVNRFKERNEFENVIAHQRVGDISQF